MRVCDGPLGLEVGDVMTLDPEALEPCGFFLRADEAGAYYRVTFAGLDAERRASWKHGPSAAGRCRAAGGIPPHRRRALHPATGGSRPGVGGNVGGEVGAT